MGRGLISRKLGSGLLVLIIAGLQGSSEPNNLPSASLLTNLRKTL